ncbi:hypothetical protein [Stenotrophomonas geniculata]|uniref:hypothetical protein n=1 Tax=Stenotrophomonas geniculata TaxID=86188 RepID=UPI002E7965B1|nr:hypothetical protein [Stenotrophomonas geniculata]
MSITRKISWLIVLTFAACISFGILIGFILLAIIGPVNIGDSMPAWVQAVGSIGALLLAIYVPVRIRCADRFDRYREAVEWVEELARISENNLRKPIEYGLPSGPPHPQLAIVNKSLQFRSENGNLPVSIQQPVASAAESGRKLQDLWERAYKSDPSEYASAINLLCIHIQSTQHFALSQLKRIRRKHGIALFLY